MLIVIQKENTDDGNFDKTPVSVILSDGQHFADLNIIGNENGKLSVQVYMHMGSPETNHLIFTLSDFDSGEITLQELFVEIQKVVPKYDVMLEQSETSVPRKIQLFVKRYAREVTTQFVQHIIETLRRDSVIYRGLDI